MAIFCLTQELADNLKQAAVRGEIDIAAMYEMSAKERRALFTKYVNEETAHFINSGFEQAMKSTKKTALADWAEKTFKPEEKKTSRYRDIMDKINSLEEMGVLSPAGEKQFLEDLVATKLGATVTAEEAAIISQKANKLKELASEKTKFGTYTIKWFEAKKDLDNYLDSITPSSNLKVLTSTIGRGTMLLSVKSPVLNVESNTVQGFLTAMERRLMTGKLGGSNGKFAVEYMAFAREVYQKSGYDITRMQSLTSDRKTLGEDKPNSQGKGKVRKVGRFYEDLVFKKLLGYPDVAFASAAFADSANLTSTKIAQEMGLKGEEATKKALDIFTDATSIEPTTKEGQLVREQARADAEYATYTNQSTASDIALGIRKLFNIASGDLRIGDQIMPFVKTPANVIQAGLDASGVTLPIELIKVMQSIKSGQSLPQALGSNINSIGRKLIRAGFGITGAYLLASLFNPEDFIGEYPVSEKERELLRLKQATTNSVKISNHWVSLDYFGPLGTPLVGMLYAKKYGKTPGLAGYNYLIGVKNQAGKIPGFTEVYNFLESTKEKPVSKDNTLEENLTSVGNYGIDYLRARLIPGIIYDIARATDRVERQVDSGDALSKVKSTIPGLRQTLPEKTNIFGETVEGEGWKNVVFGSRVKTASDSPLVTELIRLDSEGQLPNVTTKDNTQDAKILKMQIGESQYTQADLYFRDYMRKSLEKTVNTTMYQRADDEKKKGLIEDVRNASFKQMLLKYRFKPLSTLQKSQLKQEGKL